MNTTQRTENSHRVISSIPNTTYKVLRTSQSWGNHPSFYALAQRINSWNKTIMQNFTATAYDKYMGDVYPPIIQDMIFITNNDVLLGSILRYTGLRGHNYHKVAVYSDPPLGRQYNLYEVHVGRPVAAATVAPGIDLVTLPKQVYLAHKHQLVEDSSFLANSRTLHAYTMAIIGANPLELAISDSDIDSYVWSDWDLVKNVDIQHGTRSYRSVEVTRPRCCAYGDKNLCTFVHKIIYDKSQRDLLGL